MAERTTISTNYLVVLLCTCVYRRYSRGCEFVGEPARPVFGACVLLYPESSAFVQLELEKLAM